MGMPTKLLLVFALALLVAACGEKKEQVPGPQGDRGAPGAPGRDGQDGEDGEDGAQGPAGLDGTVVTPVLPCPQTLGAFPEVLLCINDQLYAVYDGNGNQDVHYALIGPGNYVTTDGRSCQFQVVQACVIQ